MTQLGPKLADGRTAEVFAWGEAEVLKLFRPGFDGGAQYEYEVACAVQSLGALAAPIPLAKGLMDFEGRRAILYQRVRGETMTHWLVQRPWRVRAAAQQLADLHIALHQTEAPRLPSQHARLAGRIQSVTTADESLRGEVMARLRQHPPGTRLCHGDFHPENVLLTGDPAQPMIVIDWTDATCGDPIYDVARTNVLLTVGTVPQRGALKLLIELLRRTFARSYLDHYCSVANVPSAAWRSRMLPVLFARLTEMGENTPDYQALMAAISIYR